MTTPHEPEETPRHIVTPRSVRAANMEEGLLFPLSSEETRQLVRTVLQLARSIGLDAVAEGVSTLTQLAELRQLDCDFGQGYLFAKPAPPD